MAGMTAGLSASQKNDYNITVLRGPSVSEVILDGGAAGFTGIERPSAILALSDEGVQRRRSLFDLAEGNTRIIRAKGVQVPDCRGEVLEVDFKA